MSERKKILVVDDDDLLREALQLKISDWGYHVDVLADGMDVLRGYNPGAYHAILMDTQMDHSLGYKICETLRKQDQKVIIIGMSADKTYHQQWMAAGANSFLPKIKLNRDLQSILYQHFEKV